MRRGAGLLLLSTGLALMLAGPASSQRAAAPNPELTRLQAEYRDETARARRLRAEAAAAGVRLHVLVDARDGRLSGERLRAAVPGWREASVWFCGPAGFGQALRRDLTAQGLPARAFHQELFAMR